MLGGTGLGDSPLQAVTQDDLVDLTALAWVAVAGWQWDESI
jgi:hypothetical protein